MCPVSTEVLSVEGEVLNISNVLGEEVLLLGVYEVVVLPGEIVLWELVSG